MLPQKISKVFIPSWVWTFWSLLAFALILILPSGVDSWFNGLPWSGALETIALALVIPFLILTGRIFLSIPVTTLALSLLLLLKIFLTLFAPQAGWGIRVYSTPEALEKGIWERTYISIWKGDFSDVLERPFKTKVDFPIEWMNRYNQARRDNPWLGLTSSGFVHLPLTTRLIVVTKGVIEGHWEVINESGVKNKLPLVRTLEEVGSVNFQTLPEGSLKGYRSSFIRIRGMVSDPFSSLA